jgi:hypothetical protein
MDNDLNEPNLFTSLIGVPIVVVRGRSVPRGTTGKVQEISADAFMKRATIRVQFIDNNNEVFVTNINNVMLAKDVTIRKP